jgi:polyhydroxybutyrate depolymerase
MMTMSVWMTSSGMELPERGQGAMGRTGARRGRIAPHRRSGKRHPGRLRLVPALLAAAACAQADGAGAADWSRRTLEMGGVARHYHLLRPHGGSRAPTLVLLQGALQEPLAFAASTGLPALAERQGFALVVPETVDGHWNDGRRTVYFGTPSQADDQGFLETLLARLVAEGVAHPEAIRLAGFSNGGLMALTLACRPGAVRPAGLLVVAATLGERLAASCDPPRPLALVLANGTADDLFPFAGGMGLVNGRTGEAMLGAAATAAFFAKRNGCGKPVPRAAGAEAMGPGHGVSVTGHVGCPPGGSVVQVTIAGGGHAWPTEAVRSLGAAAGPPGTASLAELAWAVFAGRAD